MSSALLAGLFAILGTGLAVTSAACVVLWRRVHSPGSAANGTSTGVAVVVAVAGKKPAQATDDRPGRLDDLAEKHRALEARLARVEAWATNAVAPVAGAIASHPGGPRGGRRVDPGTSATSAGPTLISVPDLATPPSPASTSEAAAGLDRRFGPVWAMADGGTPIGAIARETGYPVGQVELILGLRRRLLVAEAGPDA